MVRIWHSSTFNLETTLNHSISEKILSINDPIDLERCWSIDIGKKNSSLIAFGYDEGTIVIKIGSDVPVISMK